ncbi:hypothetical protein SAMD00019534_114890 [Acytostelium subglobosum LB1]|uniref:hypothetical protein n=1 Tax=Acytostelium subglobosum LB1 TaxID=1410327 RepID=UPI000644F05F|nr:hypothetical protein SAMD00019534_114890 [Acytostelium subglobosum LB1]GAM28313.1 hypothetical protein SAMD00019534_114890 [Acytostelium subglobosum LB1]|eukprot:XP_012748630.1 hypothetical protein SAMD00019534_114890 [Acytostelium subglobosum LB1]
MQTISFSDGSDPIRQQVSPSSSSNNLNSNNNNSIAVASSSSSQLSLANSSSPIITKKKVHHHGHHGPLSHVHMPHLPHMPHMPHLKPGKLFHGKGLKKLRMMSKKKRQRKKSKSYQRRKQVNSFINSPAITTLLIVASIFMVFIDDFLVATGAPNSTACYTAVSVLKIVVFVIFTADIVLTSYAQRLHYVISFFFLMDLISLASLVPDIVSFLGGFHTLATLNSLSLSRTARVARIASRIARISKVLSFNRDQRKSAQEKEELHMPIQPSSVGHKLLSKTSNYVIVMILLVVLITTLTNPDNTTLQPMEHSVLDLFVITARSSGSVTSQQFNDTLSGFIATSGNPELLYLNILDQEVFKSSVDTTNWFDVYILKSGFNQSEIWISNKKFQQDSAALGITLTVCIIIIISLGTYFMSRDFQVMVIKPIERMMSLIKKISSMERHDHPSSTTGSDYGDTDADLDEHDFASDAESGMSGDSDYETDSLSGFYDENEAHIIVDMLNDVVTKKMEHHNRAKNAIEGHTQLSNNLASLGAAAAGFLARKQFECLKKASTRRARIVKEMLTTEQTYVASLAGAIEGYYMPLRAAGSNLATPEQIEHLFCNIEVLHQHHIGFLAKLEERVNSWHHNQAIGDLFAELESVVDIYTTYVNNYTNVVPTIEDMRRDNKVADFLMDCREKNCKGIELTSYLIMPIQRMPRYVLLLEDLLKHTSEGHFDLEPIGNASRSLKKATVVLNERKREHENKHTIQDLYMKLSPPVPDILVPGNSIILQGKLKHDGEKFFFILLNSGLLKAAKESSTQIQVKSYYGVRDMTVTVIQDCPSIKIVNAFQIKLEDQQMLLFAKTPEQRQEWVDAIGQFTKVMVARTKSVMLLSQSKRSSQGGKSPIMTSSTGSSSRLSVPGGVGSSGHMKSSSSSLSPSLSGLNIPQISAPNLSNFINESTSTMSPPQRSPRPGRPSNKD